MKEEPLTFSDPVWSCQWEKDLCKCEINIEIKNNSPEELSFKFIVRAQEKSAAVKGPSIEILDQKTYQAEIGPNGTYRFKDYLEFKRQPDQMIVTLLN